MTITTRTTGTITPSVVFIHCLLSPGSVERTARAALVSGGHALGLRFGVSQSADSEWIQETFAERLQAMEGALRQAPTAPLSSSSNPETGCRRVRGSVHDWHRACGQRLSAGRIRQS